MKAKMKIFKPQFHLYMAKKMIEHADIDRVTISYAKARWVISKYQIPKDLRNPTIEEMCEIKVLERVNQRGLKICI